ncbi:uncharacterized protein [Aristolochia californica]|uniref:uncharacterized protein isoform X2 n=1 Tax=Aristolochia californica TaxID=171875 RepID=UPI0035DE58AD
MEVDPAKQVELAHGEGCIQDSSVDPLLSPAHDILDDIYGDPQVLPRIGAQYQVEIPPLTTELYSIELMENQSELVSKTFSEGKVSFEEYITTLKATVGLKALVEAVGIGKGKHDLTGILMEPTKINQVIASRSEIPVGKACSTLSSADIIKFLTGDFRLSKARSNDLFWEAVWPRLLARGWHSEQPKNQGYVNSKHSLVFLIPGVKKFSRRKLVKGNHYFDSVTDVLSKVSSDPRLLELDIEVVNGGIGAKEEYVWDPDAKLDQVGSSQRHCYLRPRAPNGNQELMKFTVVDTSMVQGEDAFKVRELRSLPVDNTTTESPTSVSRETNNTSSEEQVDDQDYSNDQPESSGAVVTARCTLDKSVACDAVDFVYSLSNQMPGGGSCSTDTSEKNNSEKDVGQGLKSGRPNYLAPVTKRRRLNACSKSDRMPSSTNAFPTGLVSIEEENCSQRDLSESSDAKVGDENMSQQKLSTSSSGKVSLDECSASGLSETDLSRQKPQRVTLIDLNLPHVPPDFDTGISLSEGIDSQDGSNTKEASVPSEISQQPMESDTIGTSNGMVSEDQPAANARRHSTRNRPLTTRALEALESGFFNTKRRVKGTKVLPDDNSIPRSSRRRVRGNGDTSKATSKSSGNTDNGIMDSKLEGLDEECSSNTNIDLNRSQFGVEKKEEHELLGVLRPAYQLEILTGKENTSG